MDPESVTRRLKEVAELSHLCRQLAGPRWPYRLANLDRFLKPPTQGEETVPVGLTLAEVPPAYRTADTPS